MDHSKGISINLNDVCSALFSGSNCSTFPFFELLTWKRQLFLKRWLEKPGQTPTTRNLWGRSDNLLFKECALFSQTYIYTDRHWYFNMQICMFSLIQGVHCWLEKKISNLKLKQRGTIQNVKSEKNLQRLLMLVLSF